MAQALAREEHARNYYRSLYDMSNPPSTTDGSFVETFGQPRDGDTHPDVHKAAADLTECLKVFGPQVPTDLNPMERFAILDPTREQTSADSRMRTHAIGLPTGDLQSARVRVETAKQVVDKSSHQRQQANAHSPPLEEPEERRNGELRNEQSWLDLEESQGSRRRR